MRWTAPAADDLTQIVEYIRKDNPEAAHRVARTVFDGAEGLRSFPARGRIGRAANTRELVFPPWPYIAVYEISGEEILILRIRHASRNWP